MVGIGLISCDLCGNPNPRSVLESPGLDGPLVECTSCGLRYVGRRRSQLAFGAGAADAVRDRLLRANASFRRLATAEEHRLDLLNGRWRLDLIRQYRSSGKLLEVGCARGSFLRLAKQNFDVYGVEPNPDLAETAAEAAPVHAGLVETAPWSDFDVAASFHVIEHVDSPRRFIASISERLKPGGLAVIETPDIGSLPFRIFGKHWRQLIPEHYFFFDPVTITRLCHAEGLKVEHTRRVGKYASIELMVNRLSRYFPSLPSLRALSRLTFRFNPLDIMLVFAVKTRE